ncbi:MAG: DsbA family protein [Gemmatimonadota bacterium]
MSNPPPASRPVLYFDFVDPISYLLESELRQAEAGLDVQVARVGVEINPPPYPVGAPSDSLWESRWDEAATITERLGRSFAAPPLVPWSRKAHELVEHARETAEQHIPELRNAVFRAYFDEGRDIGRVDVLVALADAVGLDRTEAKAVLDVDRFGDAVARRREEAVGAGLRVIPTLTRGDRRLEGFHNRTSLSTFLGGSD